MKIIQSAGSHVQLISSNRNRRSVSDAKKTGIGYYWSASTGNKPQKTIGVASWYPGSGSSAFFPWCVMVSPTLASATDLIEAER